MRKRAWFALAGMLLLLLAACAPSGTEQREVGEDNGYTVDVEDVSDPTAIKRQYQVPPELQSCHTAIVDGYIVEGHVPIADVERLLAERPDIVGLAVPGMPAGSPGTRIFASYGP